MANVNKENLVDDAAENAGAETTPPTKSRKESYMESFKQEHPDWQDDDEEGFYGALSEDKENWNKEREGFMSREKEVSEAIGSGGAMNAALFSDLISGVPVPQALLQRYPEEIKAWMDDPENVDALKESFDKLAENIENDKKLNEEADKNLEETNKMIDAMIEAGEIKDEEEVNDLLKFLGEIASGLMVNKVQKEWLIAAKNALNHDADVEQARTEGEIAGRNQKIVAQRKENKRGNNTHAGLGSSNAGQRLTPKETKEALGQNTGRKSMWDGMKVNKLN